MAEKGFRLGLGWRPLPHCVRGSGMLLRHVVDVVAAVDYFFVVCFFAVNMDVVSGAAVAY